MEDACDDKKDDENPVMKVQVPLYNHDKPVVITSLAEMAKDAIINETALASIIHVSRRTVQRMVKRGDLPEPFLMGGSRLWFAGMVRDWITAKAEASLQRAKTKSEKRNRLQNKFQ